jgi:hypothetical protein
MSLLREITRCPHIQSCYTSSQSNHPCQKIISSQKEHAQSLDTFQVPETWSGNIEQAPILFLSSNPSIDENEEIPLLDGATLFSQEARDTTTDSLWCEAKRFVVLLGRAVA